MPKGNNKKKKPQKKKVPSLRDRKRQIEDSILRDDEDVFDMLDEEEKKRHKQN